MSELQISNQELSRLSEEAVALVMSQWASVDDRPAYPVTSGKETQ